MKKNLMIALVLISANSFSQSQDMFKKGENLRRPPSPGHERQHNERDSLERANDRRREAQMNKAKLNNLIAFLTHKLELEPEAKMFSSLYTEYFTKTNELKHINDSLIRKNCKNLSDEQIKKMLDARITGMESELALRKKYDKEFRKKMSLKKVCELYAGEVEFEMQQKQMRREEGRPGRGRDDRRRDDRRKDDRGRDDKGKDNRGRDDKGRDDRGRDDRGKDERGAKKLREY